GLAIGAEFPGSAYREFQRFLLLLHRRGVILAMNSKNNEDEGLRVIESAPGMLLRRGHFAAYRIHWGDQVKNCRELAEQLNIGLHSMVFVDDSPVECDLVRRFLPEVQVETIPSDPARIPAWIETIGNLGALEVTETDRARNRSYRAEAERD